MRIVAALILFPLSVLADDLPDPIKTPGALNPFVTQDNIHQTVCVKGYTKKIRPKVEYTNGMKTYLLGPDQDIRAYEADHRVPLCAGGSPFDPKNIWAEKWEGEWGARPKDRLELKVCRTLCRNQMTLAEAQGAFLGDWKEAYLRLCPSRADCPSYDGSE
jgi:hypothetical protein